MVLLLHFNRYGLQMSTEKLKKIMTGILNNKFFTLIEKTLDFRTQRQDILASNIANIDTPGYQAQDLVFEKALDQAMHADEPGILLTHDSRHFDGHHTPPIDEVYPQRINSAAPFVNFDGNTVDLDREMAKIAENQLNYNATIRILSHQFKMLKISITER